MGRRASMMLNELFILSATAPLVTIYDKPSEFGSKCIRSRFLLFIVSFIDPATKSNHSVVHNGFIVT